MKTFIITILILIIYFWVKDKKIGVSDQSKFRLKIVPSFIGSNYVAFKYTTNGIIWHYIRGATRDLNGSWHMKVITYKLNTESNFNYEKEKWNSHDKIVNFLKEELEKCKKGNKANKEENDRIEKRKKEFYEKVNKN